jgi:hemicentin
VTPLKNTDVVEGSELVLVAEFTGYPVPTAKWTFQNEDLVSNENVEFITEPNGLKQQLVIHKCTTAHKGNYLLSITNKLGKAVTKCDATVVYPPRIIKPLSDAEVAQKKTAILEIELDSSPQATIEWLQNNQPLDVHAQEHEGRYAVFDRKGGVYQLVIKNCKPEDQASYTVRAVNKIGQAESTARLTVITAPAFVRKFDQVDAVEECEFKISVLVSGHPQPHISFTKNNADIDLTYKSKYELVHELVEFNHSFTLIVNKTAKSDAGTWQCQVWNDAGRANCLGKVVLHPLTPPKFVLPLPQEHLIPENREVNLTAKVSGIPMPRVTWFKDGQALTGVDTFEITYNDSDNTQHLRSKEVDSTLSGHYSIKAVNPGGEATSDCNLTIKGRLFAMR